MKKNEIRKKYQLQRNAFSRDQRNELSKHMMQRLLSLPIWECDTYHIYLSIDQKKEVNTHFIIDQLREQNKRIIVPKIDLSSYEMTHYVLESATQLKQNKYGIPEPADGFVIDPEFLDVVFVPLLAFDKKGHRVGYGKGFYDRFLVKCRSNCIFIGLSFFEAEFRIDDVHSDDIALHYAVCPTTTYKF